MRISGRIISLIITAALGLAACQKDDTLRYSNITMGNIVNGTFISDQGNTFNIKEQTCESIPDTLKRVMINCDVLSKTADNTYDVRLKGFSKVFTKAPVDSTAVTDTAVFVEDPLMIHEMWYSAGYINMYIILPIKMGSSTAHMINLVRNDGKAEPGIHEFTLKHNAFGEVPSSNEPGYTLGGTYVSFPAAGILTGDTADIIIHWNSGKENDDPATGDKRNTLVYKWSRGGFEHTIE